MDLKLYNTLTRTKEAFVPLDWQGDLPEAERRVRMYVCGPTVYDFAHIGNARPVIVFDVLFRLLRHLYGDDRVKYVRNITDVDDKINARAAERDITIRDLTETTYANFREDVKALGCLPPTVEPRATEHIAEMKLLIERLVAGGHAYVAEGHVLFGVPSMADYGRLSRRPLDEMIAGAGITQPGRPGWHIECSAMSWKHLGETFDIHGGGIDLLFPHHENEVAQTRCAFDAPFMAQVWMHNGFLQVEGEKMSKSLGNFVTIRELLADWPGEVLRLNMLRTHYRQPVDWTVKGMEESWRTLDDWYAIAGDIETQVISGAVLEALTDDLNTPQAIAALHGLRSLAQGGDALAREELAGSLRLMGLLQESAAAWKARKSAGVDTATVESLISARNAARKAKNFAESDRIRDELATMGVVLKDSKDGTTWEVAR
ncbi:MAG: cysteine--tRNA ligase [Rhizobiales bacterium]|nr:cysteine--tRNA ligase [Hyphomicrobiales bacterium]